MKKFLSTVLCLCLFLLPITPMLTAQGSDQPWLDDIELDDDVRKVEINNHLYPSVRKEAPEIKLGKNYFVYTNWTPKKQVVFKAKESGTYKFKISNLSIEDAWSGRVKFVTYIGKAKEYPVDYKILDVKSNGIKDCYIDLTTTNYRKLPKIIYDDYDIKTHIKGLKPIRTFKVKLKKGQAFMLGIGWIYKARSGGYGAEMDGDWNVKFMCEVTKVK